MQVDQIAAPRDESMLIDSTAVTPPGATGYMYMYVSMFTAAAAGVGW